MKPYKRLVNPSHRNCNRILIAVEDALDKVVELFGEDVVDRCGRVDLEYYPKGANASVAVVMNTPLGVVSRIQFSMQLVRTSIKEMIEEIVPHEVAHLICMANGWDSGHGKQWTDLCIALGGSGEVKNTLHVTDGRKKSAEGEMYEALSPTGTSLWLNFEQYQMAASRGIIAEDSEGNQFPLTVRSLTGNIIKI